jgi:hypothetical protein
MFLIDFTSSISDRDIMSLFEERSVFAYYSEIDGGSVISENSFTYLESAFI